jgi:phenylacetate-CoA ligase
MEGGIIGRIDQMLIVRGVNIFPSSIEAIVRSFPEVQEFAVVVDRIEEMDEIQIQVEVTAPDPRAVTAAISREASHRLGLRVGVSVATPESLPRFELKARRFTDKRKK